MSKPKSVIRFKNTSLYYICCVTSHFSLCILPLSSQTGLPEFFPFQRLFLISMLPSLLLVLSSGIICPIFYVHPTPAHPSSVETSFQGIIPHRGCSSLISSCSRYLGQYLSVLGCLSNVGISAPASWSWLQTQWRKRHVFHSFVPTEYPSVLVRESQVSTDRLTVTPGPSEDLWGGWRQSTKQLPGSKINRTESRQKK